MVLWFPKVVVAAHLCELFTGVTQSYRPLGTSIALNRMNLDVKQSHLNDASFLFSSIYCSPQSTSILSTVSTSKQGCLRDIGHMLGHPPCPTLNAQSHYSVHRRNTRYYVRVLDKLFRQKC